MVKYTCNGCGYVTEVKPADGCPKCGGKAWAITVNLKEEMGILDELAATSTDVAGQVTSEGILKRDSNNSASLATGSGQPLRITVERKRRVKKEDEEKQSVNALAKAYSERLGRQYVAEETPKEEGKYADGVLISSTDRRDFVNVQVTHLDTKLIAVLGETGEFRDQRTLHKIFEFVREAIERKSKIDSTVKPKTILLLIIPAPLGQIVKQALQKETFAFQGFKDIWVSPFHEQPYSLTPRRI